MSWMIRVMTASLIAASSLCIEAVRGCHHPDHPGHGRHLQPPEAVYRRGALPGGAGQEERVGGAEGSGSQAVLWAALKDGEHCRLRQREEQAAIRELTSALLPGPEPHTAAGQCRHHQDELPGP